jgi:hypothetical protein
MVVNSVDPLCGESVEKTLRRDADRNPALITHANGAVGAMPAVYGFLRGSQGAKVSCGAPRRILAAAWRIRPTSGVAKEPLSPWNVVPPPEHRG